MKNKIILLLTLSVFITHCSKSTFNDKRSLGTIDGKNITVQYFITSIIGKKPEDIKEAINDEMLEDSFKQYANIYIFSKIGEKKGFFNLHANMENLKKYTEDIKEASYRNFVFLSKIKPLIDKVSISDSELKPLLKQVQVRHILFTKENVEKNPENIKKLTETILSELKKGTPFADLATKYSQDPGSSKNGGLIEDWITSDSPYVEPFKKAALSATKNKSVIPNVQTSFGTHIIYVEKIKSYTAKEIRKMKTYSSLMEKKKMDVQIKFDKDLIEKYSKKLVVKNLKDFSAKDIDKLFRDKLSQSTILVNIDGRFKFTVSDFVTKFLNGDISKLREASAANIESAIESNYTLPHLYILLAEENGVKKDKETQKTIQNQLVILKGSIYLNSLMKKKHITSNPPVIKVSDKDVIKFYNQNKKNLAQPASDGKKAVAPPLTPQMKEGIKNFLKQQQMQAFEQEQQQKQKDFIDLEASKSYKEYKVTFNKLVKKPSKKEKTKK